MSLWTRAIFSILIDSTPPTSVSCLMSFISSSALPVENKTGWICNWCHRNDAASDQWHFLRRDDNRNRATHTRRHTHIHVPTMIGSWWNLFISMITQHRCHGLLLALSTRLANTNKKNRDNRAAALFLKINSDKNHWARALLFFYWTCAIGSESHKFVDLPTESWKSSVLVICTSENCETQLKLITDLREKYENNNTKKRRPLRKSILFANNKQWEIWLSVCVYVWVCMYVYKFVDTGLLQEDRTF